MEVGENLPICAFATPSAPGAESDEFSTGYGGIRFAGMAQVWPNFGVRGIGLTGCPAIRAKRGTSRLPSRLAVAPVECRERDGYTSARQPATVI